MGPFHVQLRRRRLARLSGPTASPKQERKRAETEEKSQCESKPSEETEMASLTESMEITMETGEAGSQESQSTEVTDSSGSQRLEDQTKMVCEID